MKKLLSIILASLLIPTSIWAISVGLEKLVPGSIHPFGLDHLLLGATSTTTNSVLEVIGAAKISGVLTVGSCVGCGTGGSATTTINNVSGPTFTFASTSETNLGITISTSTGQLTFTPYWIGTLANNRIASSSYWNSAIYTETDPLWTASSTNWANWNTAFGWGNHALIGYATSGALSSYFTISAANASNTIWSLDSWPASSTYYLTTASATLNYQPIGSYLTNNQNITLSGVVSGSGTTSITTSIGTLNLDDLSNISVPTPTIDDHLSWNGNNWVNTPMSSSQVGQGIIYYIEDIDSTLVPSYESLYTSPQGLNEVDENVLVNNASSVIDEYLSTTTLDRMSIDAGVWTFDNYVYAATTTGNNEVLIEVYYRQANGTEVLLFEATTGDIDYTTSTLITVDMIHPAYALSSTTDRLLVKYFGQTDNAFNTTIGFTHDGMNRFTHIHTPLILSHNDLANLQGGNGTQRYHLDLPTYNNALVMATTGTLLLYPTLTYANTNYVASNTLNNYYSTSSATSSFVSRANWTTIDNYPTDCANSGVVYGLGDTLSCYSTSTLYTNLGITGGADIYWTGTSTNLVAATGRTSLGLGDSAVLASSTWPTLTYANANYLATGTAVSTYLPITASSSIPNNATTGSANLANYYTTTTIINSFLSTTTQTFQNLYSSSSARINFVGSTTVISSTYGGLGGIATTSGGILGATTTGWGIITPGTDGWVLTASSTSPRGSAFAPAPATSLTGGQAGYIANWITATTLGTTTVSAGGSTYVVATTTTGSTAALTYQDITGMYWTAVANTRYDIECKILYNASVATIGIGIGWNASTSPVRSSGQMTSGITVATVGGTTASSTKTGSFTSASVDKTGNSANFTGFWESGGSDSVLRMQFRPETATLNGIIIQVGSFCKYSTY